MVTNEKGRTGGGLSQFGRKPCCSAPCQVFSSPKPSSSWFIHIIAIAFSADWKTALEFRPEIEL
jgi:hypothetical protein